MNGKELQGMHCEGAEPHCDLCHVSLRLKLRREMGRGWRGGARGDRREKEEDAKFECEESEIPVNDSCVSPPG